MKKLILSGLLLLFASPAWCQSAVPDVTKINLAWVDGVYWNPVQFPGWGFFVDAQEQNMFGAIYGYQGSNATFITLQGTIYQIDPLQYRGDVYFVTDGGNTVSDVGNFTWSVSHVEASPAATLTISSNILNISNLLLTRFVYVEEDKIDILTGADWDIVTRILGISFAESYGIFDDRIVEDGITGVPVIDNADEDKVGAAAYYPAYEAYGLLIPFLDDTNLFAVFWASDTEMFGRFWLLDPGEQLTGNGNYFRGSANTTQASNQELLQNSKSQVNLQSNSDFAHRSEIKKNQRLMYDYSSMEESPMFPEATVQSIFEQLSASSLISKTQMND